MRETEDCHSWVPQCWPLVQFCHPCKADGNTPGLVLLPRLSFCSKCPRINTSYCWKTLGHTGMLVCVLVLLSKNTDIISFQLICKGRISFSPVNHTKSLSSSFISQKINERENGKRSDNSPSFCSESASLYTVVIFVFKQTKKKTNIKTSL